MLKTILDFLGFGKKTNKTSSKDDFFQGLADSHFFSGPINY